jgi:hypothetical protein
LVRVPTAALATARRSARYAPVPGFGPDAFADLERCTTIEKAALLRMHRTRGCRNDEERRDFAQTCARHRSRFAFPNEMTTAVAGLRGRLLEKDGKNSAEGRCVARVLEIRAEPDREWSEWGISVVLHFIVRATSLRAQDPDWDSTPVDLQLPGGAKETVVAEKIEALGLDSLPGAHAAWSRLAELWVERCSTNDRISALSAMVHSEDEFPVALARRTDRLDLEHLSSPDDTRS